MAGPTKTGVLDRRRERALGALLVEPTLERAAKAAGVGHRTLRRWLRDDPAFIEAYREARRECVRRTTGLLQKRAGEAVEVLAELMHDADVPPNVRGSSARSLLEIAYRAGDLETQEQLRELERRFNELQTVLFEKMQVHDSRM